MTYDDKALILLTLLIVGGLIAGACMAWPEMFG